MATVTEPSQPAPLAEATPAAPATTLTANSPPSLPTDDTSAKESSTKEDCGCAIPIAGPVSDALPTADELSKINDLKVFDQHRKEYTFKDVYTTEGIDKHLIIFVRYFVCGLCQDYLLNLSHLLPPSSLPPRTQITIVGHGDPSILPKYAAVTQCPYPMYTDPSQKLYKAFSLLSTVKMTKRSKYQRQSFLSIFFGGVFQGLTSGKNPMALGTPSQVGGEFLFVKDGDSWKVDWGHRMKFTNDHAEIEQLAKVLGVEKLAELDKEQEEKLRKTGMWESVSAWRGASVGSESTKGIDGVNEAAGSFVEVK